MAQPHHLLWLVDTRRHAARGVLIEWLAAHRLIHYAPVACQSAFAITVPECQRRGTPDRCQGG